MFFGSGEEGLYVLLYQICPPHEDIVSTFELDFHFDNPHSYLSAGELHLPLLYLFFAVSYFLCFVIWYSNIRSIQRGQRGHFSKANHSSPPVLYPIHQIMTLVLLLKFLSILLESVKYFWKKINGNDDYWSILYNVVTFVNVTFFFIVIVLLGTGWSIVTPFIKGRVKYMIFLVLLLQVMNNIAILVLSQEVDGESSYQTWTGVLHIVDILCCCAVLVPIVWQVNDLEKNAQVDFEEENGLEREHLTSSENGNDEQETDPVLSKLKLFRSFYLLVVSYIYSTRILVYLFSSVLSYKYVWVQNFMMEVITLTFYVMVGFLFRPKSESSQYQTLSQQPQSIEEHGIAMTVTNNSNKTH
jgi:G protein-coupled receptor 107